MKLPGGGDPTTPGWKVNPPSAASPAKPPAPGGADAFWGKGTTTDTNPNSPWTRNKNESGLTGDSYQIQRGDTLGDIAQRSGLSVQDLAKANNILEMDTE